VPRGSFAPGEPIGSGFSALIFFGSFLYQDKKEHITDSLPKFYHGDEKNPNSSLEKPLLASPTRSPGSSFQNYSAPSGLVKIVRSIQGAAPLATYYAPSGLLFKRSPGSSFQNYSAPSGLVKIVRSIQGAAPLATYYAPSGLKPPDKFRREADKF